MASVNMLRKASDDHLRQAGLSLGDIINLRDALSSQGQASSASASASAGKDQKQPATEPKAANASTSTRAPTGALDKAQTDAQVPFPRMRHLGIW